MGRVLVDDDQAVGGLGDDEIVVDLCPRRTERIVARCGVFGVWADLGNRGLGAFGTRQPRGLGSGRPVKLGRRLGEAPCGPAWMLGGVRQAGRHGAHGAKYGARNRC